MLRWVFGERKSNEQVCGKPDRLSLVFALLTGGEGGGEEPPDSCD